MANSNEIRRAIAGVVLIPSSILTPNSFNAALNSDTSLKPACMLRATETAVSSMIEFPLSQQFRDNPAFNAVWNSVNNTGAALSAKVNGGSFTRYISTLTNPSLLNQSISAASLSNSGRTYNPESVESVVLDPTNTYSFANVASYYDSQNIFHSAVFRSGKGTFGAQDTFPDSVWNLRRFDHGQTVAALIGNEIVVVPLSPLSPQDNQNQLLIYTDFAAGTYIRADLPPNVNPLLQRFETVQLSNGSSQIVIPDLDGKLWSGVLDTNLTVQWSQITDGASNGIDSGSTMKGFDNGTMITADTAQIHVYRNENPTQASQYTAVHTYDEIPLGNRVDAIAGLTSGDNVVTQEYNQNSNSTEIVIYNPQDTTFCANTREVLITFPGKIPPMMVSNISVIGENNLGQPYVYTVLTDPDGVEQVHFAMPGFSTFLPQAQK